MCDSDLLKEYAAWIDEAKSKSELIDVLYDIRNDLTSNDSDDLDDDEDDNSGGRQYTKKY